MKMNQKGNDMFQTPNNLKEQIKKIYNMELHECLILDTVPLFSTNIMRVAGGWIYTNLDKSNGVMSQSFVPFDNEFQEQDND